MSSSPIFKSLGILALTAASFFQPARLLAAPSHAELQKRWNDHYATDFNVDWLPQKLSCRSNEAAAADILSPTDAVIALAFYDLETIEFNPDTAGYVPDFYNLVKKYVKITSFDAECQNIATARRWTGTMTICSGFLRDSREDRASTLVHETRHMEANAPGHVTCVGRKYNGRTGSCDDTFYDGAWQGSGYNADVYYTGRVLKFSKPNELQRSVLQSSLNTFIPDRFNQITPAQTKKWRE